nr:putative ribonuclease H protein At1g65750 family [Tanacetum cinerariifolium]
MSSDLFFYTSSDDEDEVNSELAMFTEACQAAYEASKPKVQRTPVARDRYGAHGRLVAAYFSAHPRYNEATFRELFRMSRTLFTRIIREVSDVSQFFQQRDDCTGHRGISSLMKYTFAIRQLAYESVPDSLDGYLQTGATTALAFRAQFSSGDHGPDPFILLEAIASNDLWIGMRSLVIKWDIEGDENSKFFHGLINKKRRNQMINGIMVEGTWIKDPNLIKDAFFQFYKDKFQAQDSQDCGSSKAPGPDGFSFAFVKKYWDIIQKDLHDFINSFFTSSELPCGANSSFFTLIPKVNNPTLITDFRPISLIGIHCKIIAKILANRASILVNSSATPEFSINRGLRQGDTLSPFLFILVMEGLHNAFSEAVGNRLISGININNSTINISHVFFADDVIITTEWNARDLENIIRILHVFYLASGLKINIHKSNIYGIGVNEEDVSNMASNAGCIEGNISFNYLDLPIGSNMKSIANWKKLVDRFNLRLSNWNANLLSIGGRLTLIKFVLGSLGIYYLSIFRAPDSVLQNLERIRSNFFWGGNQDSCGTRIRFWKDIWVGEVPLFIRYNRLYRLDQDKDCLIIDRINNGQWQNWSRTNIGVRNLAYFRDMLNEIGQVNIETLPSLASSTSWDKSIPRKVNIFMCRLALDLLPHRLNLFLRGMDIPAISCSSCNGNVESANHIFFKCIIASDVWKLVYRWCEIPFVQALSFEVFKVWFSSWNTPKEKKHGFYVISSSVLWWIWRFRNSVTFNSQPLRKSDIFDYVRSSLFSYLRNRGNLILSWTEWLKSTLMTAYLDNG